MPLLTATVDDAARKVAEASSPLPRSQLNPVYRALLESSSDVGGEGSPPLPDAPQEAMLARQLTSRALMVVAVTTPAGTRRLRLGVEPETVIAEGSRDDAASTWREMEPSAVPDLIVDALRTTGLPLPPEQQTAAHQGGGLRLSDEQVRAIHQHLAGGMQPDMAFLLAPELSAPLRDALSAMDVRVAVSVCFHDPGGREVEQPVSWSRLWTVGQQGVYRTDSSASVLGTIHPVPEGDVLATIMSVLEECRRFAATAGASGVGGAR